MEHVMLALILALVGTTCYALNAVILEHKLIGAHQVLPLAITFWAVCLTFSFIWLLYSTSFGEAVYKFPGGSPLFFAVVAGAAIFFGTMAYYAAFSVGGSLLGITAIVAVMPAVAAIIKFFWVGEIPNIYHIGAWVLIFVAVLLIAKGETI